MQLGDADPRVFVDAKNKNSQPAPRAFGLIARGTVADAFNTPPAS
jgi:hypothetical protein